MFVDDSHTHTYTLFSFSKKNRLKSDPNYNVQNQAEILNNTLYFLLLFPKSE